MRYMTEERRAKIAVELFDRYICLRRKGVTQLKTYEYEYQQIIESLCPEKMWWEITRCNIFMHLLEHKDPEATIIEIMKQLMED